jgi:hypothetical protein
MNSFMRSYRETNIFIKRNKYLIGIIFIIHLIIYSQISTFYHNVYLKSMYIYSLREASFDTLNNQEIILSPDLTIKTVVNEIAYNQKKIELFTYSSFSIINMPIVFFKSK